MEFAKGSRKRLILSAENGRVHEKDWNKILNQIDRNIFSFFFRPLRTFEDIGFICKLKRQCFSTKLCKSGVPTENSSHSAGHDETKAIHHQCVYNIFDAYSYICTERTTYLCVHSFMNYLYFDLVFKKRYIFPEPT